MRRILVTGITGAGKTTLARAVAGRLEIPFHEMDALALCGPGWQENPRLLQDVDAISARPGSRFANSYRECRNKRSTVCSSLSRILALGHKASLAWSRRSWRIRKHHRWFGRRPLRPWGAFRRGRNKQRRY